MGGTPQRMENFAYFIMKEIGYKIPSGTALKNISKQSHRYLQSAIYYFLLKQKQN
jgi:uridine phosphorylase